MIGLSGIAGSGKDLFCKLLLKEISGTRIALADPLKEETRGFILQKYGIDILKCSLEEKNKVRDFLVFYGGIKRYETKGTYWTDKAQKKVDACKHTPVVTDIRYAEYQNDEIHWIKYVNQGVLVHIRKYCEIETLSPHMKRVYFDPPNEDERRNDPKLIEKADYSIEWPHMENATHEQIKEELTPYAKEFAEWYKKLEGQKGTLPAPESGTKFEPPSHSY